VKPFPSRFRRLDGALADLPLEEPMLLTELDGFLTGLVVSPAAIPADEWMTLVWGPDDPAVPPFEDPADVRWFADAVAARRDEIARDLGRGRLRPILDVDDRNGEVLWEYWADGLAEAMALRPDAWTALAADDGEAAAAIAALSTLIAVGREESDLDSVAINALADRAPAVLADEVARLFAARLRGASASATSSLVLPAKVGRNDPCPCGSGRKHKRCCG